MNEEERAVHPGRDDHKGESRVKKRLRKPPAATPRPPSRMGAAAQAPIISNPPRSPATAERHSLEGSPQSCGGCGRR